MLWDDTNNLIETLNVLKIYEEEEEVLTSSMFKNSQIRNLAVDTKLAIYNTIKSRYESKKDAK